MIAFDTETEVIEGPTIPRLALFQWCDGKKSGYLPPPVIEAFFIEHSGEEWVGQNVAFDYWVLWKHFGEEGRKALEKMVDENRLHDTMILDMLYRLAINDEYPRPRDLGTLADKYASMKIDKNDPYRMRYGELIGVTDWSKVDKGFIEYAIKDVEATYKVWRTLSTKALALSTKEGLSQEYGLLSEAVQVRGAIALSSVEKAGICLNSDRVKELCTGLAYRIEELTADLLTEYPSLFVKKKGALQYTSGGSPKKSTNELIKLIEEALAEVKEDCGIDLKPPLTPTGRLSTSTKEYEEIAHLSTFIDKWIHLEQACKQSQFFGALETDKVNPRYTFLVRTGRTSASNPNIQQIPREGGLRECFIPSKGSRFFIADYAFLELRTLAAVCESRYGASELGRVIRNGLDPHTYTAAMFEGMDVATFKETIDPKRQKELRQAAKALNFGIPGGLGVRSLTAYAKATYKVELSPEKAAIFRTKLIEEVYPELSLYLASDDAEILANSLGTTVDKLWRKVDWNGEKSLGLIYAYRKVVSGEAFKADGTPYSDMFVSNVWDNLLSLCRKPSLRTLLSARDAGPELRKRLYNGDVTTLTGRKRGRVSFSQARNTPFQGLASDGAKLALWRLVREGYRVVAFVHDEVVIEVPKKKATKKTGEYLRSVLCEEMERVCNGLPIDAEWTYADCWKK
jgi:DNA polymerase I-like protein with 3'-5' exonuclease and polymerase domains